MVSRCRARSFAAAGQATSQQGAEAVSPAVNRSVRQKPFLFTHDKGSDSCMVSFLACTICVVPIDFSSSLGDGITGLTGWCSGLAEMKSC